MIVVKNHFPSGFTAPLCAAKSARATCMTSHPNTIIILQFAFRMSVFSTHLPFSGIFHSTANQLSFGTPDLSLDATLRAIPNTDYQAETGQ